MEDRVPSLLTMPELVLDNIIEKTDFFARISLEKCNKALRRYIKNVKTNYKEINILFEKNKITLKISDTDSEVSIRYCKPSNLKYGGLVVREYFFLERCVSDLVAIVVRSNVTVDKLTLEAGGSLRRKNLLCPTIFMFYETKEFLSNLEAKMGSKRLKVKCLEYFPLFSKTDRDLKQTLQLLQPGFLKVLLFGHMSNKKEMLLETTATQQWKQAKDLIVFSLVSVPLKELLQFTRIFVSEREITLADMKLLIETAVLHAENFEYYDFTNCKIEKDAENYALNHPYFREEEPLVVGQLRILNIDCYCFIIGIVTPEDVLNDEEARNA